jgi:Flp pilus assembly secretin CpaC
VEETESDDQETQEPWPQQRFDEKSSNVDRLNSICKCACIERKGKIDRNVRVERVRKRVTHSAGVDIVEGNREKEETRRWLLQVKFESN